jgi:hypothetical protein
LVLLTVKKLFFQNGQIRIQTIIFKFKHIN